MPPFHSFLPVLLPILQWPAMLVGLWGAWWLSAEDRQHRKLGFLILILGNALWVMWSAVSHAPGLLIMQMVLCLFNIRGLVFAKRHQQQSDRSRGCAGA